MKKNKENLEVWRLYFFEPLFLVLASIVALLTLPVYAVLKVIYKYIILPIFCWILIIADKIRRAVLRKKGKTA